MGKERDMSPTLLSVISWVITGAVAGYIASLLLKAERQGCFINIILGIAGAFVGAFLLRTFFPALFAIFGEGPVAGFLNGIFHAIVGSVIVLVLIELIVPGKQLGVRDDDRKRRRR
jgi:uncharacterized membrane protein YeaQ/YmgE (transglycosylase-associated protein family)